MKEDVPVLEYSDASLELRGQMIPVRLKLSDQGVAIKNTKTGKTEQIKRDDVEVLNWQRLAGGYGIRLFTGSGNLYRFGGFKDSDQSKLEKFFKNTFNKTMTDKEFSVKGWNYGAVKFDGSVLSFDIGSTPAYEIPLNYVSSCVTGKNEVTMEYHNHEESAVTMMEMRYHIPTSELAGDDAVEEFRQRVMSCASVITATGDAIAIFREIQCLTPRGRYDVKIYPSFIQLHGKTFDFKIPIESVLRLFLMPHQDQRQHFFVVSLDPPIKQGQTRYPYLIILFAGDEDDSVELPLSEEEIQEKFGGRLEKEMNGPQFELLSRLFKGLCNRKIVTPGNFLGHTRTPAISCSYKAAAGYLYPLERGLIYVHKPPIHIRFDEISSVNFARSGSTTRSFDFEVELKVGGINTFSSIDKGEYNKLFNYVNDKKLRMKNRKQMDSFNSRSKGGDDSDRDEPDHYMNRVKAEARDRDDDDDDDEDESEDSDFNPEGGEGSDVAEEFDSNASDSSDSDDSGASGDEEKKKEKAEKKKEKKPKKAKTVSENPRKKRNKKVRDENMPKRPQSSYFLWLNEHREQIKTENPGISITDVSKKAGVMWKEIKENEKSVFATYEEKAAEEKKKYEVAMKEYHASLSAAGGGGDEGEGGGGGGGGGGAKTKLKKGAKKAVVVSPTKGGSGAGYKSKEYISDSSSGEEKASKPKKKKVKTEAAVKKETKAEDESDAAAEEEEEMSDEAEGEASDEGSD